MTQVLAPCQQSCVQLQLLTCSDLQPWSLHQQPPSHRLPHCRLAPELPLVRFLLAQQQLLSQLLSCHLVLPQQLCYLQLLPLISPYLQLLPQLLSDQQRLRWQPYCLRPQQHLLEQQQH